jgi:hypothetical protein
MSFDYHPNGPHGIALDASATALWQAGDQAEIKAFAQSQADKTGHAFDVFASNAVDVLYQVAPTKLAVPPTQLGLFSGVTGWISRNLTDPDE